MSNRRVWAGAAMLVLALASTAAPASAQRDARRVAIVSAEVQNSSLTPEAERQVERLMNQVIAALFERAGYETTMVADRPEEWLSNRQLGSIAREADADWIVYPKILVLSSAIGGQAAPIAREQAGTRAVLYTRIVSARPTRAGRAPATLYMRQIASEWPAAATELIAYGEPHALPEGAIQLFETFSPLNRRLAQRGLPTIRESPRRVANAVWSRERVAGWRQEIGDSASSAP